MALLQHALQWVHALLTDRKYFWILAALVVVGDFVLTQLIIHFVSYTEIDWETYMVQVEVYRKGQLDYSKILGPTGPLVYPAGHLWIHDFLYALTNRGHNVYLAQQIYAALYVVSLTLLCAIYKRTRSTPNWLVLLLPLSKRLHSIFVLRLFNDCWSLVPMQLAILAYQDGLDNLGTLLFSLALSIKMSILLYLPGILVVLFKRRGLFATIRYLTTIIAIQTSIGFPFIKYDHWAYFRSAYDLSRVFLYKWTVNWRFLSESTFLSKPWAQLLLAIHLILLVLFGLTRWCEPDGGVWVVLSRGLRHPNHPASLLPMQSETVAMILLTSNLIGITCARSLHYQFYSWYAQQLPLALWKTPYPLILKLLLLSAIEYAWNVYPSTSMSSILLLTSNLLILFGLWLYRPQAVEKSA
ncbi:hypothetical protein AX16_004249 [Volvariella volvacea WC 439]|nr:hypothetical protein AX16_004249 [Volvariella volvacea WC 439]